VAPSTGAINRCCRQQISGYRIRLVGSTTVACAALVLSLPVAIVHSRRATKSAFMRSSRARGHAPSCSSPPRANRCEDDGAATRRHGMTLDKRKRSERKARAGRGHFASSRSPTQSIPTGKCRCSAWRWRPQHPVTACRMSRSRCRRAGTSRPGPGGFGAGSGSVSAVVVTRREHERKGYFHWVDLCLGHYWDTAAVRH